MGEFRGYGLALLNLKIIYGILALFGLAVYFTAALDGHKLLGNFYFIIYSAYKSL